mmetsp:Transcript_42324/g.95256  ORF Transcript_42324/g.95256 Transcript_42324/m.95256 type:complete len:469 (+) Transcript_42324:100-1506(+)
MEADEASPENRVASPRLKEKSRQPYDPAYPAFHKACVATVSSVGQRNLAWLVTPALGLFDTVLFFDSQLYPGVKGKIALTIDDAPCRQSAEHCLSKEVCDVLEKHNAKATFFVSAGFVAGKEEHVVDFLRRGHEIANHAVWDCPYTEVDVRTFEQHLLQAEEICDDLRRRCKQGCDVDACLTSGSVDSDGQTTAATSGSRTGRENPNDGSIDGADGDHESCHTWTPLRWFRAPGGALTGAMHNVLERHGFQHVLGDCYANDAWVSDPEFIARMLVEHAADGGVLVLHMPEKGFREHCLKALELLLLHLHDKGLQAVTLDTLHRHACECCEVPGSLLSYVVPDMSELATHPGRHMIRSTNALTGFVRGTRTMYDGFIQGVSGTVLDPWLGWYYDGTRGLAAGIGSGLSGLITRPIGGVVTGAVQMAAGVGSTLEAVRHLVPFGGSRNETAEGARPFESAVIHSPEPGSV